MTAQALYSIMFFVFGIILQVVAAVRGRFTKKSALYILIAIVSGFGYLLITGVLSLSTPEPKPAEQIVPSLVIGCGVLSILMVRSLMPNVNEFTFVSWSTCFLFIWLRDFSLSDITNPAALLSDGGHIFVTILVITCLAMLVLVISKIKLARFPMILVYLWFVVMAFMISMLLTINPEYSSVYVSIFDESFLKTSTVTAGSQIIAGMIFFYLTTSAWFLASSFIIAIISGNPNTDNIFKSTSYWDIIIQKYNSTQSHPVFLFISSIVIIGLLSSNQIYAFIDTFLLLSIVLGITPFVGTVFYKQSKPE